jgi:heat-inducible transcriptional repressor
VHLLEETRQPLEIIDVIDGVTIRIGKENQESKIRDYSIITAQYNVGNAVGTVGVIGPTRMDYAKIVRVIDYVAKRLSNTLTQI